LHYGLARTKDKNLAKVRLTKALSESGKSGLQVPADVKALEADMKREWTKVVRKAARAVKTAPVVASGGKKRKTADVDGEERSERAAGIEVRVAVNIDVAGIAASQAKATPKKARTETVTTSKASTKQSKAESASIKSNSSSAAAKKAKTDEAATRGASSSARGGKKATGTARSDLTSLEGSQSASSQPRARYTAKRSAPFMANSQSYRPPALSPSPDMMDIDDHNNDAPPAYDSHNFDSYRRSPPAARPEKRGAVQITGHYDVETDMQAADYGSLRPKFTLVVDTTRQELWGSIAGPDDHHCVLWGENMEHDSDGDVRVSVQWRSETPSRGQYLFRRNNEGIFNFDGAGGVSGTIYGLLDGENVEFEGNLTHKYDVPDVEELRREWDAIPRRAYGRR
jgi:hypothetical protein